MIQWRITGVFSPYDAAVGANVVIGVQWHAYAEDLSAPEFPRRAEMMGNFAFKNQHLSSDATSDSDVFAWMTNEGFDQSAVEAQLNSML